MSHSRIPSPARSQGAPVTPRRYKFRTRSVESPARSTASGKLSALIQFRDNNTDSFVLSPAPSRRSVLNDDTDIEEPRRRSWWKKLADNSRDVMEVLNDNKVLGTNEAVEEYIDIEVLSQEKKNYSIDIPESSDSESISSIVIPQRKLFTQKDQAQNKFGQLIGTRETLAKLHKSHVADKTVTVAPKNLFGQGTKPRAKPVFPAALLNLSSNKTANKTKENDAAEVKGQVRNLFGNRAGTKRKNMFADFIVSESDDEISEIQPRVFGFPKKAVTRRDSENSRGKHELSPSSSVATDIEMDDWKMIPSSTMVENQLEEMMAVKTPVKKARLSKLTEIKESVTKPTADHIEKEPSDEEQELKYDDDMMIQDEIEEDAQNESGNVQDEMEENAQNNSIQQEESEDEIQGSNDQQLFGNKHEHNETHNTTDRYRKKNETKIMSPEAILHDKTNHLESFTAPARNSSIRKTTMLKNMNESKVEMEEDSDEVQEKNEENALIENNVGQYEAENEAQVQSAELEDEVEEDAQNESNEEVDKVEEEKEQNKIRQQATNAPNKTNDEQDESENKARNESNEELDEMEEKTQESAEIEDEVEEDARNECGEIQENIDDDAQNDSLQREENEDEIQDKQQIPDNKKERNETHNTTRQYKKTNETKVKSPEARIHDKTNHQESFTNQSRNTSIRKTTMLKNMNESKVEMEEENAEDQEEAEENAPNESNKNQDETKNEAQNESAKSQDEIDEDVQHESDEEIQEMEDEAQNESAEEDEIEEVAQNESIEMREEMGEDEQNESQQEEENATHESKEEQDETEYEEQEESAESQDEIEEDVQNESDEELEEMEDEAQNESAEVQDETEENEQNESGEIQEEIEEDAQNESRQQESEDEIQDSNDQQNSDNEQERNETHDTTGRYRKKIENKVKSPEAILHDKTNHLESFTARGRNTSIRKSTMLKNMNIRQSLPPSRESTGLSDGTRNSSAEGSGWDSHRTTRKTLRQTFGKDFTPRKSLRAMVMEKSAKRQTAVSELTSVTAKFPQANSTELPEPSIAADESEMTVDCNHDVSKRTRQTTLETYLQKIKMQNMERKLKMEEEVRNSLKAPSRDILNPFKMPSKPIFPTRKLNKAASKSKSKAVKSTLIPLDDLPAEVIEDMKYKPPKRFQPSNASWITKRLYKFLESKLESKYDYKARVRAEKLVETIYHFTKDLRRVDVASVPAVDALKNEMARLNVVKTHFDFYQFFHEYMPREIRVKVVPDVVNKINVPRHGVFSDIIRGNTVQG